MAVRPKRRWQPRELRMAVEFCLKHYPGIPFQTRVRVGSAHPELILPDLSPEELAMLKVYNRWVDAVVLLPKETHLIEVKIRSVLKAISELELYERLFKMTPEFKDRISLPLVKILVYAIEDPVATMMAREKGIRCILYKPDWLPEYLAELSPRETRAPLTAL